MRIFDGYRVKEVEPYYLGFCWIFIFLRGETDIFSIALANETNENVCIYNCC
jgi:hypothetical protein